MADYSNAFTEVYTILNYLDEKEYEKIPSDVLEAITTNMNEEYYFEMNGDFDLKSQEMLPETKAILFNLFRDYLSTKEQQAKIIRMQKEERQKNEIKKQQTCNINIFPNNKKDVLEIKENTELVEYKENFI